MVVAAVEEAELVCSAQHFYPKIRVLGMELELKDIVVRLEQVQQVAVAVVPVKQVVLMEQELVEMVHLMIIEQDQI